MTDERQKQADDGKTALLRARGLCGHISEDATRACAFQLGHEGPHGHEEMDLVRAAIHAWNVEQLQPGSSHVSCLFAVLAAVEPLIRADERARIDSGVSA